MWNQPGYLENISGDSENTGVITVHGNYSLQTLPDRIREWNQTACKSSETNHRELVWVIIIQLNTYLFSQVRIRTEIDSVKKKLEETDKKVVALEAAIAR